MCANIYGDFKEAPDPFSRIVLKCRGADRKKKTIRVRMVEVAVAMLAIDAAVLPKMTLVQLLGIKS